jgi:hypothetical protein
LNGPPSELSNAHHSDRRDILSPMNYRHGLRLAKLLVLSTVLGVASFAQQPLKKTEPKPDNWQKTKECAAQSEKVIAERKNMDHSTWENHYSPKYNRCFLAILDILSTVDGAGKDFSKYQWQLLDAFERSDVAAAQWDGPTYPGGCRIEGKQIDCATAKNFINEHLKN